MTEDQIFTLIINGQKEELNCKAFAKLSKSVKDLVDNSQYSAEINRPISQEAAETFLSACRGEQFRLTPETAPELLYIANEWQIESLEQYVLKYMIAKGLNTDIELPNRDYLQELVDKCDDHLASDFVFDQVARNLNDYFEDSRLSELNVEALFRVILIADNKYSLDQEKYRTFVLKLYEENIYVAVPLIMKLNFTKLTAKQERTVIENPETFNQNINYFIALAVASTRNIAENQRKNLIDNVKNNIETIQTDLRAKRHEDARNVHEKYKERMDKLKQTMAEQKRQIEAVKEYREDQTKRREEENALFEKQTEELRSRMQKEKQEVNYQKKRMEKMKDDAKDEFCNQMTPVQSRFEESLKEEANNCLRRQDSLRTNIQEPLDKLQVDVKSGTEMVDGLRNRLKDLQIDLADKRTALAAKMVKDFLRYDGFVRRTNKRFQLFQDMNIWSLSPNSVKNAEVDINQIERRLDKLCPIRHNVTQ